MYNNQISAFEYVSILVSIILGLGITQLLSSFSDVLYHFKKVKFYWPHLIWIVFILFLHIQDWFVTYQLKDKPVWQLWELMFILIYPISLFIVAKMLLPTNEREEETNLKLYYFSQYALLFFVVAISVLVSILFNIFLLNKSLPLQMHLIAFLIIMLVISIKNIDNEWLHKILALIIALVALSSMVIERNEWVIK